MRVGARVVDGLARRSLFSPGERILTEKRGSDKHLGRLNITISLRVVKDEEKSSRHPMVPNDFAVGMFECRWSSCPYRRFAWWAIQRRQSLHYYYANHRSQWQVFVVKDWNTRTAWHVRIEDWFDFRVVMFCLHFYRPWFDRRNSVLDVFFSIARSFAQQSSQMQHTGVDPTGRPVHRSMKHIRRAAESCSRLIIWLFVRSI